MPAAICARLVLGPLRALRAGGRGGGAASAIALLRQGRPRARRQRVLLKYFLSSQSAILWMSVLFFMSTAFYWIGFFAGRGQHRWMRIGSRPGLGGGLHGADRHAWCAGSRATRSAPDIGHIPVSNLYEVFVLFCWLTSLFYLYYEQHYTTRALGAFVMLVVSAAVGFLLWYTVVREAHEIQPLVPALQSWWMKLHVPANFIGYGSFALSAMVAFAYLREAARRRDALVEARAAVAAGHRAVLRAGGVPHSRVRTPVGSYWAVYFGDLGALIAAASCSRRTRIAATPAGRSRCSTT